MDRYSANADVQRQVAEELLRLLSGAAMRQENKAAEGELLSGAAAGSELLSGAVCVAEPEQNFRRVLEIGCGDGLLTRPFVGQFHPDKMTVNDLCHSAERFVSDLPGVEFVAGDAENMQFEGPFDLILSGSTLQWFSDLPAFFAKCSGLLAPDGILAFSTFGPDNLKEFAALEGTGLEYPGTEELKAMLSVNFANVSIVQDHIVMVFRSPAEVLRHLKNTGVTGVRKEAWTKGRYAEFIRRYGEMFATEGGVTLTWHPIWAVAAKPSQH